MSLDKSAVRTIADLARIKVPEEDLDHLAGELSNILTFIEQLKEVDTENTKTCRYVLRGMLRNRMRDDEIKDLLPREKFLEGAPDQIGGMIRIPIVMKPSS